MRIVALEEHYTVPRIVAGISPEAVARLGFPGPEIVWGQTTKRAELAELGEARIALARAYNHALAEACARYRGFAHLPMHSPDAAADE